MSFRVTTRSHRKGYCESGAAAQYMIKILSVPMRRGQEVHYGTRTGT